MNCPSQDEWSLASMDVITEPRAAELRAHLQSCDACRERFNETRRGHVELMRTYEALDRGHDRRREQLMASLPDRERRPAAADPTDRLRRRLGGLVMSLTRRTGRRAAVILAPAACIVLAVVAFFSADRKSAFAAAIEHFRQARVIVCDVTITERVHLKADPHAGPSQPDPFPTDGFSETSAFRSKLYLNDSGAIRRDEYEDEQLVGTVFYPADGGSTVLLNRRDRTYREFAFDQELEAMAADVQEPDVHFMSLADSPHRLLRGLRNLIAAPHRELGRESKDGRELIGFAIDLKQVGLGPPMTNHAEENRAELWIDAETGFVTRLMFRVVSDVPKTGDVPLAASYVMTVLYDGFEWDPPLAPDWFAAVIPDGFGPGAETAPEHITIPDEAALIEGLRVFHDLTGRYPASLNVMSLMHESAFVMGAAHAKRLAAQQSGRDDPAIPHADALGGHLQGLGLFALLEMKGRRPEYFGDTVTAADAGRVLLRWTLDNGRLRVIYGDLRVETVPKPDGQP